MTLAFNTAILIGVLIRYFSNDVSIRSGNDLPFRLGIGHTTSAVNSLILFYIVLYYCYLRYKRITKTELALLGIIIIVMFYLTNTRYMPLLTLLFF